MRHLPNREVVVVGLPGETGYTPFCRGLSARPLGALLPHLAATGITGRRTRRRALRQTDRAACAHRILPAGVNELETESASLRKRPEPSDAATEDCRAAFSGCGRSLLGGRVPTIGEIRQADYWRCPTRFVANLAHHSGMTIAIVAPCSALTRLHAGSGPLSFYRRNGWHCFGVMRHVLIPHDALNRARTMLWREVGVTLRHLNR